MTATPLSQAPLWRWSAQFYQRAATDAWALGLVPWRITNCVRVAEAYGRLVTAWRADLVASGHKKADTPVQVLELGGGSGRLAFHLVRWLEQARVPFQLTWTDGAQANVDAFKGRDEFARRAGVVEALKLDAAASPYGPPLAPDVVIASYLFDSLPHDAWAVRAGRLHEQQVRVTLPDGDQPECERAQLAWVEVEALAPPPFVRGYAPRVCEGAFLVPTGALRCLDRITEWSRRRCLVLVADKGEPTVEALQAGGAVKLQRNGGGISAMVNFDAVRAYWGWRPFLASAQVEPDLGFYALAQGLKALAVTRATWSGTLGAESLLHRLRELDRLLAAPRPLGELLRALEAWRFDPDVFVRMAEPLRALGGQVSPAECAALVEAVDRCWQNHYELGGAMDVAFEMATVLQRAGQLSHAARFYERSLLAHGRHATACFNLALCRLDLGERLVGEVLLREVLRLQPGHAGAARVLARL